MLTVCWVLAVFLFVSPFYEAADVEDESSKAAGRQRRAVTDTFYILEEVTGRNCTDFINYGNWCGKSQTDSENTYRKPVDVLEKTHGKPVDVLDRCCYDHFGCYELVKKRVCAETVRTLGLDFFYPYWHVYDYHMAADGAVVCDNKPEEDPCRFVLCRCDVVFVNCLKRNLAFYNKKHHKPQHHMVNYGPWSEKTHCREMWRRLEEMVMQWHEEEQRRLRLVHGEGK